MIGRPKRLSPFVLGLTAFLSFQPQHASAAAGPVSAATAGVSGDHWQVSVRAKAAQAYSLTLDGKPVARTSANLYDLNKLARGLHTVDIGLDPRQTLLIRESGARPVASPAVRTQVSVVTIEPPDPRRAPATIKLKQGDIVQVNISAAAPTFVHLHGYDIAGDVGPTMPLTMVFDANLAGRFPLETHGKSHGAVAWLEIYPR